MKKGKKILLLFINRVMAGMLLLLGFASCKSETPDEYGCPYAKYEIKGKVVDDQQKAISGAQIIVRTGMLIGGDAIGISSTDDILYTAKDGTYLFEKEGHSDMFRIVCHDPSGVCKSDSTDVMPRLIGKNGWYQGSSSDVVNFELKKK